MGHFEADPSDIPWDTKPDKIDTCHHDAALTVPVARLMANQPPLGLSNRFMVVLPPLC